MYEHNEFMKCEWEWRISKPPTLENRVLLLLAKSDPKLLSTCCCPTQLMFACTRAHSAMKSRVCGWDGDSLKETFQLQPAMRKDGTDTYVDLTRLQYIATSSYVGVPSRDKRRRPRISLHVTNLST